MRRETLQPSAEYNAREHVMDGHKFVTSFYLPSELSNIITNTNFKTFIFRIKHFQYTNVSKYSSQYKKGKRHIEQIRQKRNTRKRNIDMKS